MLLQKLMHILWRKARIIKDQAHFYVMQPHFTVEIFDMMTCVCTPITPKQAKTDLYFHEDINKVMKASNGMYCKVQNIPLEVVRAEISMMARFSAQQFYASSEGKKNVRMMLNI
jgi:hypothetical protein